MSQEQTGAPAPAEYAELDPDTADLVRRFSDALAAKLISAEKKYGYSNGWMDNGWMDTCRAKLLNHVEKGDPLDVAAYCAFLWHHGESTNADTDGESIAVQGVDRGEH